MMAPDAHVLVDVFILLVSSFIIIDIDIKTLNLGMLYLCIIDGHMVFQDNNSTFQDPL